MPIPASSIVNVTPGVVSAGGTTPPLTGLLLDNGSRVPLGSVLSFPSQLSVATYFGAASAVAAWATAYFNGFDNSPLKPNNLLVAQYNQNAVGAWLRGGSVAALTLTQLQAINATLNVTINGTPYSGSVNLTAATGFVNAASIINTALAAPVVGVDGVVTGAISATTLTVSAVSSGQVQVGDVLSGSGVTAGTYITALGTGTGGTGTYTVSASQTVGSTAITASLPAVSYDATSGGFLINSSTTGAASTITFGTGAAATSLNLTQATGAVNSQGAIAATPAGAMNSIVATTTAWASFTHLWNASTADKLAFAAWNNGQNNRFAYVFTDTDVTATQSNFTGAFYQIQQAGYSGVIPVYDPSDVTKSAFVMGTAASINFSAANGRVDFAFRSQSGLTPGVTGQTVASQLQTNGYNYYGQYATATTVSNIFYPGSCSGPFKWADSYFNQIWLNTSFQAALFNLLVTTGSVPYNDAGYNMIQQACMDTINSALNFGAIRPNVPLSSSQIAAVNNAAGVQIDKTLSTRGWYLQVLPATAPQRVARQSPPITFWYMDGQAVQQINLASYEVQ
jgi:hypothetical protein